MYVLGTAGHVDHGKSALVMALSGIDPDRLPEEKARGLTIDLGFAWMTTAPGETIGIVDVPGHERFVKNMIAGVGAIDFVLFVVAADDGWMPQSAEHLAILQFLGVSHGIVVITKRDIVEPDWLTLVADDVRRRLAGTFLENALLVMVDSLSGQGLAELKSAIDAMVTTLPRRGDLGKPRLYIDRAFTMTGRGVVVTGTLIDGMLETGQTLAIVPGNLKARVRELQVHGHPVTTVSPGQRVAVNLAGVEGTQLHRGQCLVAPSDAETADRLWADVHILPEATHPLERGRRVLVMAGTAEPEGVAYPLDGGSIPPGGHGFCELRLHEQFKVRLRDRFVLRWPTPGVTIGGGVVLDVGGTRLSRRDPGLAARLQMRRTGTLTAYRTTELQKKGYAERAHFLSEGPFPVADIDADLLTAEGSGEVILSGHWILDPSWVAQVTARLVETLKRWHDVNPHSAGLNLVQWQEQAKVGGAPMDELAARLAAEGRVARSGDAYHLPVHTARLPQEWTTEADALWRSIATGGFQPPPRPDLEAFSEHARVIIGFWVSTGRVVALGEGVIFPVEVFKKIRAMVVAELQKTKSLTAAQLRDLLGTSRRYAVPILEALDREGITRRVGDIRVLTENE